MTILRPIVLVLLVYGVASIITFIAYGWDKRRASRGNRRTSEQTLHTLELLGGWPGALIAQRYFRHKWKKGSYMIAFWAIVAIHVATWAICWTR